MPPRSSVTKMLENSLKTAEKREACFHPREAAERHAVLVRYRNGKIVKPFKGLYARKYYWESLSLRSQLRHIIKGLSLIRPSWTFSHASAALMCGLEVSREIIWPIHYLTDYPSRPTKDKRLVHHFMTSFSSVEMGGVPLTCVEQTVVDCAAEYPFQLALPIADSALHQGLTNKARLTNYLNARVNRRGARKAARVIKAADPRPDNGGESRVRALMMELGLPEPELQAEVPNPERPGHFYYVDFLFTRPDGVRVAMELDGQDKYRDKSMTSGRDTLHVMMAERQREAAITSQGIQVVRFSYRQATNPEFLLGRLAHYGIEPAKNITPL